MNKMTRPHKIDTVFVLLIFCFFAMSVLLTLMLGGSIYKHMTDLSEDGYDERTCLSYIWSKVKNDDEAGRITVGDFGGISALCLVEVYGDTAYETRIYLYDGWVYELFCEAGLGADPEDGTPIIKSGALAFEALEDGLIKVSAGSRSILISPRGQTGSGVTPV